MVRAKRSAISEAAFFSDHSPSHLFQDEAKRDQGYYDQKAIIA